MLLTSEPSSHPRGSYLLGPLVMAVFPVSKQGWMQDSEGVAIAFLTFLLKCLGGEDKPFLKGKKDVANMTF